MRAAIGFFLLAFVFGACSAEPEKNADTKQQTNPALSQRSGQVLISADRTGSVERMVPVYRFCDCPDLIDFAQVPEHTLPPEYQSGWVKGVSPPPEKWEFRGTWGPYGRAEVWRSRMKFKVLEEHPADRSPSIVVSSSHEQLEYVDHPLQNQNTKAGLCYLNIGDMIELSKPAVSPRTAPGDDYQIGFRLQESLFSFAASGLAKTEFIFRNVKVNVEAKMGLYAPAPSRIGFKIQLPDSPVLEFAYGLRVEKQLGGSDGARFTVYWAPEGGGETQLWTESVGNKQGKPSGNWFYEELALDDYAGQRGTLVFETSPGVDGAKAVEESNPYFDYTAWGHPILSNRVQHGEPWDNVVLLVSDAENRYRS